MRVRHQNSTAQRAAAGRSRQEGPGAQKEGSCLMQAHQQAPVAPLEALATGELRHHARRPAKTRPHGCPGCLALVLPRMLGSCHPHLALAAAPVHRAPCLVSRFEGSSNGLQPAGREPVVKLAVGACTPPPRTWAAAAVSVIPRCTRAGGAIALSVASSLCRSMGSRSRAPEACTVPLDSCTASHAWLTGQVRQVHLPSSTAQLSEPAHSPAGVHTCQLWCSPPGACPADGACHKGPGQCLESRVR